MGVLKEIHKWIEPYKYDNEIDQEKKTVSTKKKHIKVGKLSKIDKKPTELDAVNRGELGVKIITVKEQLDEEIAFQRMDKSGSHIAYYYHSSDRHQIAVRFEPKSGFRYYKRNGTKLKNFKPIIEPKYASWDKTHLIPIGFHGSESDPRLLIGWSSKLNRGAIKKHENKVVNINEEHTIYWFIDIEKTKDDSAYWTSTVWLEDGTLAEKQKFYDKDKFYWSN